MSTANLVLSEEHFLCPICLHTFADPVTTPCGHNFCKACITQHWDVAVQVDCPTCKKAFYRPPDLAVNTLLLGMVGQFRESLGRGRSTSESGPQPAGDVVLCDVVLCDICVGPRVKAVKSCLVCLMSYCETHLAPHRRTKGLRRHKLIEPAEDLEERVCAKHDRPLETFCKTDRACVCQFCTETDHKGHRLVSLGDEYEDRKTEMRDKEARVGRLVQERLEKITELKDGLKLSREDAEREKTAGRQVFGALIRLVERSVEQLVQAIEDAQRAREQQAEGFIAELQQEIHQLMEVNAELQQLSNDADHLRVVQRSSSLSPVPNVKTWTGVQVLTSHGEVASATASQLEERLAGDVAKLRARIELSRVQRFAVDVTFDPETAHREIFVSDDGKQIVHGGVKQDLLDNPRRFLTYCVLGEQSFSSGRFYYEVLVEDKTEWTVGVARESVNRRGWFLQRHGNNHWSLCLVNGDQYREVTDRSVGLTLASRPQRLGVFVDYEEGRVTFYDVNAQALIFSTVGWKFQERLRPFFSPGHNNGGANSAPMVICSVDRKLWAQPSVHPAITADQGRAETFGGAGAQS